MKSIQKPPPSYGPINDATRTRGISRSRLYLEMGAGRVAARKIGRRTLVDLTSLDAFMASLPAYAPRAPQL